MISLKNKLSRTFKIAANSAVCDKIHSNVRHDIEDEVDDPLEMSIWIHVQDILDDKARLKLHLARRSYPEILAARNRNEQS